MDQPKNIKYNQILTKGKELFWKYGIKRVAIEEICKQAHVSKMTFYKYFKNKKELVLVILDNTVGKALKDYKELIGKECSFTEKIKQMLKMKLEGSQDVSKEFIMDIYQNPTLNLIPYMEELGKKSLDLTIEFLLDSQKKGFIRKEIKIDFILYYFNQMLAMTTDTALLSKYEKPQDLIMEATEFFFYGIGAKHLDK
ncbi:MAG: TetR/AcrR family transcriptional regulator [Bacteroidales bacterium]|nr:TetR/AcrR family transcriptional regulator [Bacteroidales bacterium]